MQIAVRDIPEDGLEMDEAFDPKALDLGIQNYLAYESPVEVHVRAVRIESSSVRVSGQARAHVQWTCSRCLKHFTRPLEQPFSLNFLEKDADAVIDPTHRIREEIILSYPIRTVCKADCKGLCTHCGADRNENACRCKPDDTSPFGQLKELIK